MDILQWAKINRATVKITQNYPFKAGPGTRYEVFPEGDSVHSIKVDLIPDVEQKVKVSVFVHPNDFPLLFDLQASLAKWLSETLGYPVEITRKRRKT